jgi:hypothetical protein
MEDVVDILEGIFKHKADMPVPIAAAGLHIGSPEFFDEFLDAYCAYHVWQMENQALTNYGLDLHL